MGQGSSTGDGGESSAAGAADSSQRGTASLRQRNESGSSVDIGCSAAAACPLSPDGVVDGAVALEHAAVLVQQAQPHLVCGHHIALHVRVAPHLAAQHAALVGALAAADAGRAIGGGGAVWVGGGGQGGLVCSAAPCVEQQTTTKGCPFGRLRASQCWGPIRVPPPSQPPTPACPPSPTASPDGGAHQLGGVGDAPRQHLGPVDAPLQPARRQHDSAATRHEQGLGAGRRLLARDACAAMHATGRSLQGGQGAGLGTAPASRRAGRGP